MRGPFASCHTGDHALTDHLKDRISPFVVGVSGHRDVHPDTVQHLRAAVSGFLEQLKEHLPHSELRIVAGMAAGADLLVARAAVELGFSVEALLPMPLAQYAADFDGDSLAQLEELLAHPRVHRRELLLGGSAYEEPPAPSSAARDARYSMLTQGLMRGCSLLIALWDGEPSPLPGGTADTVLRYLGVRTDATSHDSQVQFRDAPVDQDIPARFVYWIPTERSSARQVFDAHSPCFLMGIGDNALHRLPAMPQRLEMQLRSLDAYNREYQHFVSQRRAAAAPDSLLRGLPATLSLDPRDVPTLERIDAQYGKADALAVHFQRRSDRLFKFLSSVGFALGLAYLAYDKHMGTRLLLLVYLLILIASAGVYYTLHERRWFANHLMCRALAETLRVKFYLRVAHADHLVDAEEILSLSGIDRFPGFGWIGHVLRGVEAEAADGAATARQAYCDGVAAAWIENQRQYFLRKVAKLHQAEVRTRWLKRILFGVILAVVLALLLLGESAGTTLMRGITMEAALTFVTGLVAVMLAAWELHRNKMATRELLWQYRNQLKHFQQASLRLARTVAVDRRLEVLATLGRDSLMESYLWTIHRFHREHEPPGLT